MQKKNLELKALIKSVNLWHKNKSHKSAKLPEQLVSAIQKLGDSYKPNEIANLLKLSTSAIRKFTKVKPKKTQFIEMPSLAPTSPFSCTLQRVDGAKLVIALQTEQLAEFMRIFLCSN